MRGLKLMAVLARPDARALAGDGALAQWAAEGAHTYLVIAAPGTADRRALGRAAARAGVRETFTACFPGERLDAIDPSMMILRLVEHIRRLRPEMVATHLPGLRRLDPDSAAIAELAGAAVAAAGDPTYHVPSGRPPHRVWIVDAPHPGARRRARVA